MLLAILTDISEVEPENLDNDTETYIIKTLNFASCTELVRMRWNTSVLSSRGHGLDSLLSKKIPVVYPQTFSQTVVCKVCLSSLKYNIKKYIKKYIYDFGERNVFSFGFSVF